MRNVLEQAILRQSNRIVTECIGEELTKEDMCCLKKEDFKELAKCEKTVARRIGFAS